MSKTSVKKGAGKGILIAIVCCIVVVVAGIATILILMNKSKVEAGYSAPVSATAQATVYEAEKNRIAIATANFVVNTPAPDPEEEAAGQASLIKARNVMLNGVSIGGIDVGGLTEEQAREKVSAAIAGKTAEPAFTLLHNGSPFTLEPEAEEDEIDPDFAGEVDEPVSLSISVDIDSAVKTAFGMLREGSSNVEIINEASRIALEGYDIPLSYCLDKEDVALYVASIAEALDSAPVNASVRSENKKLVYTESQSGYGVDREALIAEIMSVDPTANVQIEIPMTELDPALTEEMLQTQYVLRGSYSTSFSGSTSNRKFNIKKGVGLINGTILQPDEVFSTNAVLGVRTKANGWKTAGAYDSGQVVQQAGGGVCQLSGTLFNAVVLSDLEIVERRNHSMPVHYLDKGRDATINSVGNIIDFKFKNNTSSPIIVIAYTDGNKLHFEIYGQPIGDGEYDTIKIKTKQTGSTRLKTITTEDPTKPVGYEETVTSGSIGYSYETYKEFWKDGKKIRTEFLCKSNYKMFPKEVIVGTKEVDPEITPRATEVPEKTSRPDSTPRPTSQPDPDPTEKPEPDPTEKPKETEKPAEKDPDPTEKPAEKEPEPKEPAPEKTDPEPSENT